MSSLVLELQQDALSPKTRVSDLLRKAFVVARKLKVTEFATWISHELNGYQESDEIPKYRILEGQIKARHPYRGWIPVVVNDPEIGERLSRRPTNQSIGEIEAVIERLEDEGLLIIEFPKGLERDLMGHMPVASPPTLHIPPARVIGILDTVRNIVLNWSLKLEEDGILGEGLTFSEGEKSLAMQNNYTVNNFYGPVSTSWTDINAAEVNIGGDVVGRDKKSSNS